MTEELFSPISQLWAESAAIVKETEHQFKNDLKSVFRRLKVQIEEELDDLVLHEHIPDPGLQWWTGGQGKGTPHAFLRMRNMFKPEIVLTKNLKFILQSEGLEDKTQREIRELRYQEDLHEFCEATEYQGDLLNVDISLDGDAPIEEAARKIALLLKSIARLPTYPG